MDEGSVIAEFEKNSREVVRVSLTEYKGQELLDVRAYYQSAGEWKPGKGLALRRSLVTPLRKALQAAEKAAKSSKPDDKPDEKADEAEAGE